MIFGQLLALDNSEAGILDQEPKNPLSFGYETGRNADFSFASWCVSEIEICKFVFPIGKKIQNTPL